MKLPPTTVADVARVIEADESTPRPSASWFHGDINGDTTPPPIEVWPIIEAVLRRWRWLAIGGVTLALAGCLLGSVIWKPSYSVSAQLIRYDSPTAQEVFGYRQVSAQTLASVLRAPELLRRVAEKSKPPMSTDALAQSLKITPDRNSELLTVTVFGREAKPLVDLANLYAHEAARFTGEVQARSATEVRDYQRQQLLQIEGEIAKLNQQLLTSQRMFSLPAGGTAASIAPARPAPLFERLSVARGELVDLLARYTEAHPFVKEQHAKIAAIERQLNDATITTTAAPREPATQAAVAAPAAQKSPPPGSGALADLDIVRTKLQSLETGRLLVLGRERAAQLFAENPPGYFRVFAEATTRDLAARNQRLKVACLTIFCALAGAALASSFVLWREFSDDRLRGASDVRRVSHLPVIATLGDLRRMNRAEREDWAFRTWTALQNRLSLSPNHGMVCGVTSAGHGEGRTTWMGLLAEAASQQGFRVLTIATRPAQPPALGATEPANGEVGNVHPSGSDSTALALNDVLASPAEVTEKLIGPNSQPLVHIPLPGWVWNLDRRKQWKAALGHWSQIDNIVILVELPPASQPEAVLLGENLPNVIWLADSGRAQAARTRTELETLRHARCNLVGAVLNHEPDSLLKNAFPRWLNHLDGAPA